MDLVMNSSKGLLRNIFGKAAALISLGATLAFYTTAFQISKAYYQQWRDNKAEVTAPSDSWDSYKDRTKSLPWETAGIELGLSLGAGFGGIALGKSRRRANGD